MMHWSLGRSKFSFQSFLHMNGRTPPTCTSSNNKSSLIYQGNATILRWKTTWSIVTLDILHSSHEEADTKVCFHALSTDNEDIDILIRASDTDIAVILLYHCTKYQPRLWKDVGTAAKNNRLCINISAICHELGSNLCAALPAFHSFTGSDHKSSFVGRGNVRPFKILEKRPDYQSAFKMMTKSTLISDAAKASILDFTTSIYGAKDNTGLNNCRYQNFMQSYGPKGKGKNLLSNLRGTDASGLPPCEGEVSAHIKRASFVAKIWSAADKTTWSSILLNIMDGRWLRVNTHPFGLMANNCWRDFFHQKLT